MPDTLNRSELIARRAQAMPAIPAAQVEAAVKTLLDALAESLASGQRIEIRGFGGFSLHNLPPRLARNPKTGEAVLIGQRSRLHFKPGQEMRNRVNPAQNGMRDTMPRPAKTERETPE